MLVENHQSMLQESGTVISVEPDALWVETIQKSTCGSCAARKGCGQSLLAKMGSSATRLKVMLDGQSPEAYKPGDQVTIAIAAETVLKGSLLVYLFPLAAMIVFLSLGHTLFNNEVISIVSAIAGMFIGSKLVRHWVSESFDGRYTQPVLYSKVGDVIVSDASLVTNHDNINK